MVDANGDRSKAVGERAVEDVVKRALADTIKGVTITGSKFVGSKLDVPSEMQNFVLTNPKTGEQRKVSLAPGQMVVADGSDWKIERVAGVQELINASQLGIPLVAIRDEWQEAFDAPIASAGSLSGAPVFDRATADAEVAKCLEAMRGIMKHNPWPPTIPPVPAPQTIADDMALDPPAKPIEGNPFVLVNRTQILALLESRFTYMGYSQPDAAGMAAAQLQRLVVAYPRNE